jgi:hypothetical protein
MHTRISKIVQRGTGMLCRVANDLRCSPGYEHPPTVLPYVGNVL